MDDFDGILIDGACAWAGGGYGYIPVPHRPPPAAKQRVRRVLFPECSNHNFDNVGSGASPSTATATTTTATATTATETPPRPETRGMTRAKAARSKRARRCSGEGSGRAGAGAGGANVALAPAPDAVDARSNLQALPEYGGCAVLAHWGWMRGPDREERVARGEPWAIGGARPL